MTEFRDITGFIMAGGASRRMGYDKRYIQIGRSTFLRRAGELLEDLLVVKPYYVGDNLSNSGIGAERIICDAKPCRGPLGGLVSALEFCPTTWCLILAIDMPLLQSRDLLRLFRARDAANDIIALSIDGRPEPLAALYNKVSASYWRERLNQERLNLRQGIMRLKWKAVLAEKESLALTNINQPEDRRALKRK